MTFRIGNENVAEQVNKNINDLLPPLSFVVFKFVSHIKGNRGFSAT